jgi:uncharacterized protein (DUF1800 family)
MKKTLTLLILFTYPILVYSQIYNDYIGAGHDQGVIVSSSSQDSDDQSSIDGSGVGKDLAGASRFMSHASLGANLDDLLYVDEIGYEAWLNEQFDMPATSYSGVIESIYNQSYDYYVALGGDPEEYYPNFLHFRNTWSHITQNSPDVLRHRVSLALSELLVISSDSDLSERGFGLASYYDVLAENAFGNYKDLLMEVTLHPMMGFYLSHFNNPKSDPANNVHPDENYAREIMQLFTIGLYELNPDGTRQIDSEGDYIPTYDNDDIKELAKVFTGLGMTDWILPDIPQAPDFGYPFYYIDPTLPMTMYQNFHEPGLKTIVGDYTINEPSGMAEIELAVDHLFNHPNVGPFVCTRLIQRLIKSNPTPDYVERIATIFNDNGNGVRGDLRAVIAAILMDDEARACEWIDHSSNGRLKEPIQRYTQYVKGLRAETTSGWFWNYGYAFEYFTDQFPMHSPTVFNFFLPDYQANADFADENLVGPEFQIYNSSTSVGYFNYVYYMQLLDFNNELPEGDLDQLGVLEDYKAYLNIPDLQAINTKPEAVVDYLDLVIANGNMSQETRDAIVASCDPLVDFPDYLLKMALYLTMISPDFAVMK